MLKIDETVFASTTMPDFWADDAVHANRLTAQDVAAMPDDAKDLDALKVRLYDLLYAKLGGYDQLELHCDIKRNTFQKIIRFSDIHDSKRNINYTMLAKFSIGAKLTEAEATELFSLMGHTLNERNRCDYILLHELRNHGTLDDYDADMIQFGYGSVISKAD